MALKNEIAKRAAKEAAKSAETPAPAQSQSSQKINPEIDQRLTQFMDANPRLVESYRSMEKETLVRKLCLSRMFKSEQQNNVVQQMQQWVNQRPQLKEFIDKKMQQTPTEKQSSVFKALVTRAMQQESLKSVSKQRV